MGMVDSQPHSYNNRASMDGTSDEKEEKAKAPVLVPTYWGYPGAYSYPEANICIPKNRPPEVSPVACNGEGGPL